MCQKPSRAGHRRHHGGDAARPRQLQVDRPGPGRVRRGGGRDGLRRRARPSWTRWPRCRPTRTSATCPRCWPIELAAACAEFVRRRYGWAVDPADVHHVPDVIKALELAITRYSRPGSPVILPTPAYMPFLSVPGFLGREIIQVRMRDEDGFFTFDLDAIEDAFRAGGHLLIFCNPYNPLGRVFTAAEIAQLTDVVDRHGGRVFADEIHAPAGLPRAAAHPVRRHLADRRGAHADRHLRLQGLEPARPQVRPGHPVQRPRPGGLGGDGLLRLARGQQPRRGGQHRRLPARRGVAGRGPGLPRRQPPAAGRPAAPPPAPGALPPARRHVPGLARLHGAWTCPARPAPWSPSAPRSP